MAVAAEAERRRDLARQIIDTRRVFHTDRDMWKAMASDALRQLSPQLYYPVALWNQLPWYERRFLLTVAAGRNCHSAVLVGRSAARVNGMWVVALTGEKVELASTSRWIAPSVRRNPEYEARHFRLAEKDTYAGEGYRATRLTRTAIDIARLHGFAEGLIAFDWLLRAGAERRSVGRAIASMGRVKGNALARRCLRHATALSESPFESLARALLIEAGFDPQPQHSVGAYRADLAIDGWLLIEIDGDSKYEEDTAETIKRENDRKKRIENQGYKILRYRPAELLANPTDFVSDVEAALHHQRQLGA
ncbi:endonuclease domain-containing protein [Corynebacterium senegalense]|uniref:endonuclease domain-containing protein n=1 Tax=Corynebacterium senegalense TaxID=2080750 RepID=UPI001FE57215|nr:DUF559 domain-containing protein [Corynebacterium senegalense]